MKRSPHVCPATGSGPRSTPVAEEMSSTALWYTAAAVPYTLLLGDLHFSLYISLNFIEKTVYRKKRV